MSEKFKVDGRFGLKTLIIAVLFVITAISVVFSGSIFGEGSIFNSNPTGIHVIDVMWQHIPMLISIIRIVFIAWVVIKLTGIIVDSIDEGSKKFLTALRLIKSVIQYSVAIFSLFLILHECGVDTTTLLASAGIMTLVIGLGAQSLIADIIAGIFTVFEGEYEVGDIVVIDGWRGVVMEIGLRTTKIMDTGGNMKIVNNSSITTVINQTKRLSLARAYIGIDYAESVERVELVIQENLDKIKANIPRIVNGPYYKGIDKLDDSAVTLLFTADCDEDDVYLVQRALNRELKLMFDANGIGVPFPQVTVSQPGTFGDLVQSEEVQKKAKEFAEEQREISKGREISE